MKLQHLALALSLGLAACSGGSSDPKALNDDGYQKLSAQDFEGAKSDFEAAAAALGDNTSDPQYKDAKLGLIEALAHADPEAAKTQFMALAEALGDGLTAGDYGSIGGTLVSADQPLIGLDIVNAGLQKYKGDAQLMKVIEAIKKRAASDPALTGALSGLGYI